MCGRAIAANSIRAYRKALELCYLVEASEVFDVFEKRVIPKCGVRLFYTDLALRAWRFGAAPTFEAERVALNELYLELRRTHEKVYTPYGREADFVTVEADGTLRDWHVNCNKDVDVCVFRAVSGGGGKSTKTLTLVLADDLTFEVGSNNRSGKVVLNKGARTVAPRDAVNNDGGLLVEEDG